jgi:hypothetical protein
MAGKAGRLSRDELIVLNFSPGKAVMPSALQTDAKALLAESNEQLLERMLALRPNDSEFRVIEIILSQRQARRQERRIEAAESRALRAEKLSFASIIVAILGAAAIALSPFR